MKQRNQILRWGAVAVMLLLLTLIGLGLKGTRRNLDALTLHQRGGTLWAASQLEFEYLRLTRDLGLMAEGAKRVSPDDIQLRFDLLWSRRSIAAAGEAGKPVVQDQRAAAVLPKLGATLLRLERPLADLQAGDHRAAQFILDQMLPFETPLHNYVLAALSEQAEAEAGHRAGLMTTSRAIVTLAIAIALTAMILVLVMLTDVRRHRRQSAERAALLDEARSAYRAKSQFLSTVSHELRTPLTSIKGALGILRGNILGEMPPRAGRLIGTAYDNTERLIVLINDILDLEKSETGTLRYSFGRVDLSDLLKRGIEAHRDYRSERNITFRITSSPAIALTEADDGRIMQVLSNLISNAVKFSHQDGVVELGMERAGDYWQIRVQDYGLGISEEFQKRIFEKFTQEDSSDTRKENGTGLGLSITRRIVEDHGGSIWVTSRQGEGSCFLFSLPASEPVTMTEAAPFQEERTALPA